MLVNLLDNAIKFTPASGSVTVEGRREAGGVRMCVHDTGEGIPEDQLGRLFQKFVQVERKDRRKRPGTGLGLAFVKLAVEAHGGQVSCAAAWARAAASASRSRTNRLNIENTEED